MLWSLGLGGKVPDTQHSPLEKLKESVWSVTSGIRCRHGARTLLSSPLRDTWGSSGADIHEGLIPIWMRTGDLEKKFQNLNKTRFSTTVSSHSTSEYTPQRIESRDSNRHLYTDVHSGINHNRKKVSIYMNKQHVVHPSNGILFSLEKEGNPDTSQQHG